MKLTSYKVTRHEDQFQLIWILVLAEPQRVILFVKVLPEIRQRDGPRVVVGVHAFPVLHIECSAHRHTHAVTHVQQIVGDSLSKCVQHL